MQPLPQCTGKSSHSLCNHQRRSACLQDADPVSHLRGVAVDVDGAGVVLRRGRGRQRLQCKAVGGQSTLYVPWQHGT